MNKITLTINDYKNHKFWNYSSQLNSDDYDLVIKDNGVSGTTDFFDREGGRKIKELIHDDVSFELYIADLDRIGRNIACITNTCRGAVLRR